MAWRVRTEVCEGGWAREGGGGGSSSGSRQQRSRDNFTAGLRGSGAAVGGRQGNLAALHNRQQQRGSSSSSSSSTGRNSKTAAATSVAIWLRLGRRRVECRRAQRRLDRGNKNSSKGVERDAWRASERGGVRCLDPSGLLPPAGGAAGISYCSAVWRSGKHGLAFRRSCHEYDLKVHQAVALDLGTADLDVVSFGCSWSRVSFLSL